VRLTPRTTLEVAVFDTTGAPARVDGLSVRAEPWDPVIKEIEFGVYRIPGVPVGRVEVSYKVGGVKLSRTVTTGDGRAVIEVPVVGSLHLSYAGVLAEARRRETLLVMLTPIPGKTEALVPVQIYLDQDEAIPMSTVHGLHVGMYRATYTIDGVQVADLGEVGIRSGETAELTIGK
jgi:hypothetical protein